MFMITTTEKVWYEFNAQLKFFILKRIPDEQSAEDILQDVFLKIHTHIDALRNEEKLQSWIYQITRNAIIDYYRHHKATLALPETLDLPDDPVEDANERAVAELAPYIKSMVDSLPGDYSEEGTPVPIPNTEVKLFSSDDTVGAAPWENRTSPFHPPMIGGF